MKLSVVIPVFNAEKTIETVCNSLISLYGRKYRLQIILVNDGSMDGSDMCCRHLHEIHPELITYIRLARNFGEHNAVMAGLNEATGDYCVIMDDDLQNPAEEVGRLVEEVQKGHDVVYARYDVKKDTLFRNLGSIFNDKMATLLLRKPPYLYLSSFKVMNRFLYKEVIKYAGPLPYIDAIILRTTDNIGTRLIEHRRRPEGNSGYTLGKLVGLWGNMVVSYSLYPLRIIGILGILLMFIGVAYAVYKAYDDVSVHGKLTNYETLMSFNLFFRGLVMFAVNILGEYVGRIYLLLSRDPQFVIRERIGGLASQMQSKLLQIRGRDDRR